MDKLIDCVERNGRRWVGIIETSDATTTTSKIKGIKDTHELAEPLVRSKLKRQEFKQTLQLSPAHMDTSIEYACVYVIDASDAPHYIGYTLAVDFSDPALRHSHPSLAGLSKLRNNSSLPRTDHDRTSSLIRS